MRLGIVGSGGLAQTCILPTIQQMDLEIVYIYVRPESEEKGRRLVHDYDLDGYFTDYDKMLSSDVEVIYIALPNHLHFPFAQKALMAGKHVIIEKPITVDSAQLNALIDIAKEKGCFIFEAMTLYYLPNFKALEKEVEKIGRIRMADFNYSQYSSKYDKFKDGEIFPAFDPKQAGGALMDLNVYNISAMVGLFGVPDDVSYTPNIERGIDISGALVAKYRDFTAVCVGCKDCAAKAISTIQGEEGTIYIPNSVNGMRTFSIEMKGQEPVEISIDQNKNHFVYEFKEIFEIIKTQNIERAMELLQRSIITMAILDGARASARINFEDALNIDDV